ncbi:uncharacterized protein BX664DRAFT_318289 [Halteromyces radiatus]|uniref:uncharacterized protein n=1 Tax=Halteromyces radiatus TaxID=101107 RepID=UPI00221EE604|nr:uncharacterized protein BX664DRAFT_318289 [Halteromyces radiatus]KAI8077706.1 hypothetical protein BX664DRAFT_318289 [Halteromyces radiatus]
MIMKPIIFIYIFTLFFVNSYAIISIIPKKCMEIANEVETYAPQVYSWMIQDFCIQCGKPIPYSKAEPYINKASKEIADKIIPYVRSKVPKTPKGMTPEWIASVLSASCEAFSNHEDICKFDWKISEHQNIIAKAKQIASKKAMPKVLGMLPMAGECKKGIGIATHIMNDVPLGKSKEESPINIRTLIQEYSQQLCKSL